MERFRGERRVMERRKAHGDEMMRVWKERLLVKLGVALQRVSDRVARRSLPAFANRPQRLTIAPPYRISNGRRIWLGEDIWLGPGSFLQVVERYPGPVMTHPDFPVEAQVFDGRIALGHRVSATAGLQVAACAEVTIGDDVMFASNVHITDSLHGFRRVDIPYKYQPLFRIAPVRIGTGSWLGQNVVVLPGVTIGEQVIVGANSVVTRDVPPRSIAVGAPARVVKQWSEEAGGWIAVQRDPE